MAYIGREPQIGNYQVCDAISVVNAQAAYTMQVSSVDVIPESVNHMIVSLNGVIQNPGGSSPSYTISNATITFSRNLVTGETIDFIYLLGNVLDLGTPSDDTVTGAKIVDNAINSEHYTDGSIDTAHIAADQITNAKIADDQIDSEHYVDGSIDTAHIAADQITNAKIADDQIDSEHYVDGSIDTAHIADVNVTQGKIADQAINEAKMQISNGPTNGYLLSAQSGNTGGLTWAAAPSSTWTKIETLTVSGTPSSVTSGAVFSATYGTYVAVIRNFNLSSNSGLGLRLSATGGGALSSGYQWTGNGAEGGQGAGLITGSASDAEIELLGGTNSSYHVNSTQDCLLAFIYFGNPYNGSRTSINWTASWENATDLNAHINIGSAHPSSNQSYDKFILLPNTGNFTATTIIDTYGISHA